MAANDYEFVTRWRIQGSPSEVYAVLIDGAEYPRWWPDVYLNVIETNPAGEHGLGLSADLITKGKLPYRLRWSMRITECHYPEGFTLEARGDFDGRGVWSLKPDGEWTDVVFDWRLRAEKALLRWLSWIMKPVFSANHRWAMDRGEESLRREVERRRNRNEV
jgi:hypothetical protein